MRPRAIEASDRTGACARPHDPKRGAAREARSAGDERGAQTAIQIPIQPKCDHVPLFFRKEVEFEEAGWLPKATRVGGPRCHLNLGFLLNPVLLCLAPETSPRGLILMGKVLQASLSSQCSMTLQKLKEKKPLPGKKLVVLFPLKATTVTGGAYTQFCSCAGGRETARVRVAR